MLILALMASWNSLWEDCNFTETPDLNLKLVVRRLQFHRNSGFFQASLLRLFWPPNGLRGQIWPHHWLSHGPYPLHTSLKMLILALMASWNSLLEDGHFTETPDLNFQRKLQDVDLLPQVKTRHSLEDWTVVLVAPDQDLRDRPQSLDQQAPVSVSHRLVLMQHRAQISGMKRETQCCRLFYKHEIKDWGRKGYCDSYTSYSAPPKGRWPLPLGAH